MHGNRCTGFFQPLPDPVTLIHLFCSSPYFITTSCFRIQAPSSFPCMHTFHLYLNIVFLILRCSKSLLFPRFLFSTVSLLRTQFRNCSCNVSRKRLSLVSYFSCTVGAADVRSRHDTVCICSSIMFTCLYPYTFG